MERGKIMTERDEYMEARNRARELVRTIHPMMQQIISIFDGISRNTFTMIEDGSLNPLTDAAERGAQDGTALALDEIANELMHAARWEKAWDFEIMQDQSTSDPTSDAD